MRKHILVLGSTGMLGSMIYHYLTTSSGYLVSGTTRARIDKKDKRIQYFNANEFLFNPHAFAYLRQCDYIINCIGIIKPHCKDTDPTRVENAIKVNALFPHTLAHYCLQSKVKIIQIATDCVFSGMRGSYTENDPHDALDVYGKTKSLGEAIAPNILHIRCSIIGPEHKTSYSLLEWFLNQKTNSKLQGFSHHRWNGVTTLQFAQLCQKLIDVNAFDEFRRIHHLYHFVPNNTITKYELLRLLQRAFHTHVAITRVSSIGQAIDRSLTTTYPHFTALYGQKNMKTAIAELQLYMKSMSN